MNERPPRLTVDEYFDLLTFVYACRGTCDRLRTATTIRDKNDIFISAGYNGAISKDPHCDDIGHLMEEGHCIRTNHGEENAYLNCPDPSRIEGGSATILGNPCYPCARKLVGKKISKLRYIGEYKCLGSDRVRELCDLHKVTIEHVEPITLIAALQKTLNFMQGPGGLFKDLPPISVFVSS